MGGGNAFRDKKVKEVRECGLVWLEEHTSTNRVLVCQYLLVHLKIMNYY